MDMVGSMFTAMTGAMAQTAASAGDMSVGWGATVGLGNASEALTMTQGVTTAGSMLMNLASAGASVVQGFQQSSMDQARGTQEGLQGEQQALQIQRQLLIQTGRARAGFAAAGVDISAGGNESSVEGDLKSQADTDTQIAQGNAKVRQASAGIAAQNAILSGVSGAIAGIGRAGRTLADNTISIAARG
jgi:hypothetical protein